MQEEEDAGDDRRRWQRRTVIWRAQVHSSAGEQTGWVRNISAAGMALQCDTPIDVQGTVTVTLEKYGTLRGEVVWQREVLHGIAFVDSPDDVITRFGTEAAKFGMV